MTQSTQLPENYSLDELSHRELEILRLIAKGLSDREIADILFLSIHTVKWHNRQIYGKLNVPNRRKAVALVSRAGKLKPDEGETQYNPPISNIVHNLPNPVTSFIGREDETKEIIKLVGEARLISLVGPGGIGKTRLAQEVAHMLAKNSEFADGIYFVDLAPLEDADLVTSAILSALDIKDPPGDEALSTLIQHLKNKNTLIILDNFDKLIDAGADISKMLKSIPKIKIITTSRESLQLYGEHIYEPQPLRLTSAVELFTQRAIARKNKLKFDPSDKTSLESICQQLDQLPLAIELAAAQISSFNLQELEQRLNDRLNILKTNYRDLPERQRTLRASLSWSYDLLEPSTQTVFGRLGIFSGGFSPDAVNAVCGHKLQVDLFDEIKKLKDKSLLVEVDTPYGPPRFHLLETIREYAIEVLKSRNEYATIQELHANYYADLTESEEIEILANPEALAEWNNRIELDLDNIRAAFNWNYQNNHVAGLQMFIALERYWFTIRPGQGKRWVARALEMAKSATLTQHGKTLITAGIIYSRTGDWITTKDFQLQAIELLKDQDDYVALGWAFARLGLTYVQIEDFEYGEKYLSKGLAIFRDIQYYYGTSHALNSLGELMRMQKRYKQAIRYYEESHEQRLKVTGPSTGILFNLAATALFLDQFDKAKKILVEGLENNLQSGDLSFATLDIGGLAGIFAREGKPEEAARLLGSIQAFQEIRQIGWDPSDKPILDRSINEVKARLDTETFQDALAAGRAIPIEDAIELALELSSNSST